MIDSETIGCPVNEILLRQFEIDNNNQHNVIVIGTGGLVSDIAVAMREIEKLENPIIFIGDNKNITSEYNIGDIFKLKQNINIASIIEPFIEKKKHKGHERPYKYHR